MDDAPPAPILAVSLFGDIERLPFEWMNEIATRLADTQDFCNLRLVNKWMLESTEHAAANGLFRESRSSTSF